MCMSRGLVEGAACINQVLRIRIHMYIIGRIRNLLCSFGNTTLRQNLDNRIPSELILLQ